MDAEKLFAIVLAGGSGSRFGSAKQLAMIGGRAMVSRAMVSAEACCRSRTVLVSGNEWPAVVAAAHPDRGFFVVNTKHASGLSGSIAAGIRSVRQQAAAVLLLLADQPLVTRAHLQQLVSAWRDSPQSIVASAYANTCGPPVIFPARFFDELLALRGDTGARMVLNSHRDAVIEITCADAAVDVDTPADLKRVQPDEASG